MSLLLAHGRSPALRDILPGFERSERHSYGPFDPRTLGASPRILGWLHENCVCTTISCSTLCRLPDTSNRVESLTELISVGLGLPRNALREAGKYGYVQAVIHAATGLMYPLQPASACSYCLRSAKVREEGYYSCWLSYRPELPHYPRSFAVPRTACVGAKLRQEDCRAIPSVRRG
jgi:hypothetical protein